MKSPLRSSMFRAVVGAVASALMALAIAGCTRNAPPSDQEIREKSAQAARDAREGARNLADQTRVVAGRAVDGVNAVTQGVKEGMEGKPGDRVDINHATAARLALLPGVSLVQAEDIVKGRPYGSPHELVTRGLITQRQYDQIGTSLTVH